MGNPTISYLANSLPPRTSPWPGPALERPLRILVVDDSQLARQRVREEFEPIGAHVVEADSGQAALELARTFHPDAITLDVELPDLDGYTVCSRLKTTEETMGIPVVVVSGNTSPSARTHAFLAGAAEHHTKPFERGALREFVDQLLVRIRAHHRQRIALAVANSIEAEHVENSLRAHGYCCELHSTPGAGIESLARGADLLVLDLDYEDDAAFAALLAARDRTSGQRLPVIAVTSSLDRQRMSVAFNAGAADVVRRPFFPEELAARVDNQLRVVTLEKRLVEEATLDPLTGLFNRRQLARVVIVELKRAARHGEPLGVLIADLDHFKRINDTHGHGVGDEVLSACAREMTLHIRATDVAARYGGEEFVFLLPGDRGVGIRCVAERIRMHVEALRVATLHGPLNITVSLGGSWWEPDGPHHRRTLRELLDPADQALYAAKHEGRNRCVVVTAGGVRRGGPAHAAEL